MSTVKRETALHVGLIGVLFCLCFLLPAYHQGNLARIMVLATYAVGYNVLFGYTGLLSLGHAMFFAAGMYGLSLWGSWRRRCWPRWLRCSRSERSAWLS